MNIMTESLPPLIKNEAADFPFAYFGNEVHECLISMNLGGLVVLDGFSNVLLTRYELISILQSIDQDKVMLWYCVDSPYDFLAVPWSQVDLVSFELLLALGRASAKWTVLGKDDSVSVLAALMYGKEVKLNHHE